MDVAEPPDARRIGGGRHEPMEVGIGVAGTLVLHAGLVALIAVGTLHGGEDVRKNVEKKMLEFEDVKLLKLGKDKPDHRLPRKANPPPPEPQQETVALEQKKKEPEKKQKDPPEEPEKNPDPPPKKKPKPKQEPENLDQQMEKAFESLHNPRRPTNDDVPEGSKKGVAAGTLSDEALANLMGTYEAKLISALTEQWTIPETVSDDAIRKLAGKVEVYVRLSESGHVVSYEFRKRSSNRQFDRSVERVLRRFQVSGGGRELPLPENRRIRRIVLQRGLNLKSWKYTGR